MKIFSVLIIRFWFLLVCIIANSDGAYAQCVVPPSGKYMALQDSGHFYGGLDRIYGSNSGGGYSTDSAISTALVHAGLLKPGEYAYVTITPGASYTDLVGSTANGVTSSSVSWWATSSGSVCGMILAVGAKEVAPAPALRVNRRYGGFTHPGESINLDWQSTNATSISYTCIAKDTGFNGTIVARPNDVDIWTLGQAAWIGYPSSCFWTATGPAGLTTTVVETVKMTTLMAGESASTCQGQTPASATFTAFDTQAAVWGNNYDGYSVDSDIPRALLHAGLLRPGESARIKISPLYTLPKLVGTNANGIASTSMATGKCGMSLAVDGLITGAPAPTLVISPDVFPASLNTTTAATLPINISATAVSSMAANCTTNRQVNPGEEASYHYNLTTPVPVPGNLTNFQFSIFAYPQDAGYTVTCNFTVTGLDNSVKTLQRSVSITHGKPVFNILRTSPALADQGISTLNNASAQVKLVAGTAYHTAWSSFDATSISQTCSTPDGTADIYRESIDSLQIIGDRDVMPKSSWAIHPSTCIWTITGPGGITTYTETVSTVSKISTLTPIIQASAGSAAGATIAMSAALSYLESAVTAIRFSSNNNVIGWGVKDGSTPIWRYSWTSVPAGTYNISALAFDANGTAVGMASPSVPVNVTGINPQALIASVQSPVTGSTGDTITLWASLNDARSNVATVKFFNGATLIGTGIPVSDGAPYPWRFGYSWTSVPAGSYSIQAQAFDAQGNALTPMSVAAPIVVSSPRAMIGAIGPGLTKSWLSGWTCTVQDETASSVTVYLGGKKGTAGVTSITVPANLSGEPGLARACNTTNSNFRFNVDLTPYLAQNAGKTVYVYGNSRNGGEPVELNLSGTYSLNSLTVTLQAPATSPADADVALSATLAGGNNNVAGAGFYANGMLLGNGVKDAANVWRLTWPKVPAGTYSVTAGVFATLSQEIATESAALQIKVGDGVLRAPSRAPAEVPVAISDEQIPQLANPDAGTLPGRLAASGGAATYGMPITVPPGTAGMAPALTLNYSSLGNNGMLGMGWSLNGLSTIYRCNKTIAQDGSNGRISFDGADRLCLDGKRLVRVNGTNPGSDINAANAAYWWSGAEYRTELETFSRITRLASGGFKVEAKDGLVHYYGIDTGSIIAAQGRTDGQTLAWTLARTEDRSGNYLTIEHSQDAATGEYLPKQIRYGGNTVANQTADLAVRFSYEVRDDAQVQYMGGSRNDLRSRLTHIQTFIGTAADGSGGVMVRDYALHYIASVSSGRSLLDSIQACALNSATSQTECLPKTTFDWGQQTIAYREEASVLASAIDPIYAASGLHQDVADLDGDGLPERISPDYLTVCPADPSCVLIPTDDGRGNENAPYYYLRGTLKTTAADGTVHIKSMLFDDGTFPQNRYQGIAYADLDGDGRADIILSKDIKYGTSLSAYCLNDGSEVLHCKVATINPGARPAGTIGFVHANGTSFADIDNDHKTHMIMGMNIDCFLDDTHQFLCRYLDTANSTPATSGYLSPLDGLNFSASAIDFSKQGITDFYSVNNLSIPVSDVNIDSIGTCVNKPAVVAGTLRFECQTLFQHANTTIANFIRLTGARTVGDLNGDGLTDFVYADQPGYVYVCLGKENGVDCQSTGVLSSEANAGNQYLDIHVGDFAGDGLTRILIHRHEGLAPISDVLCRLDGQQKLRCSPYTRPALAGYVSGLDFGVLIDPDGTGIPRFGYTLLADLQTNKSMVHYKALTLAAPASQDKVIATTNGLGQRDEVDYARSNEQQVYRRFALINGVEQRPVYPVVVRPPGVLVKQLRHGNGQGGWLQTNFHYEGAYLDAKGRGSLGFQREVTTDVQTGIVTTSVQRLDFPFIGMVAQSETVAANNVSLSKAVNVYAQQSLAQANGSATIFSFLSTERVERHDLDGSDLGATTSYHAYADGWGNQTGATTYFFDSVAKANENVDAWHKMQVNSNYSNAADTWLLGKMTHADETQTAIGKDSITRTLEHSYDSLGRPATETRQGTDPALALTTGYDRSGNPFGLINTTTLTWRDPVDTLTKSRNAVSIFDVKGRFIVSKKNALGQKEFASWDAATGAQTGMTRANGVSTTWSNDAFGRKRKEIHPDGTETRTWLRQCVGNCPVTAATMVQIVDNFKGDKRITTPLLSFIDSASHVLRTESWGFDGHKIVKETRYDARGRSKSTDWLHYDGDWFPWQSSVEYDDLNRITSTTTWEWDGAPVTSTNSYHGLSTTAVNGKNQSKTDTRDTKGRVIKSVDAIGGVTLFGYDAFDNLSKTVDPTGNVIVVSYDALGHKTALNDPDLGLIEYKTDPVGQLYRQISPRQRTAGLASTFKYDNLGRMTDREEPALGTDQPGLSSHWVYDAVGTAVCDGSTNAARSCGQLVKRYTGAAATPDFVQTHSFDYLGRPDTTATLLDVNYSSKVDVNSTDKTEYDAYGRAVRNTIQRGQGAAKVFDHIFNAYGDMASIQFNGAPLWVAQAQDANARVTRAVLGNGLTDQNAYEPHTGRLTSGTLQGAQGASLLQENYAYDVLGNISGRAQTWQGAGFGESFSYDGLNRLQNAQVNGLTQQVFTYDGIGNMLSKTGVGAYTYPVPGANSVRPHAVSAIANGAASMSFVYDANGNMTSGAGRTVSWTGFDMPARIARGGEDSAFAYGPEHQRIRQIEHDGTVTYYAPGMEVQVKGTDVTVKTYWPANLGLEIEKTVAGVTTKTENWTHLDRLGSIIAISDATGNIIEKLAYDSWGKRRTLSGDSTPDSLDGVINNRGFTGHEMLDKLDLVHMNGRIYDPLVARFMSADPLIQDPMHGQSLNRYAYVWNNPTNLTDPTGFETIPIICNAICRASAENRIVLTGDAARAFLQQLRGSVATNSAKVVRIATRMGPVARVAATRVAPKVLLAQAADETGVGLVVGIAGLIWGGYEIGSAILNSGDDAGANAGDAVSSAPPSDANNNETQNSDQSSDMVPDKGRGLGAKAPQQITPTGKPEKLTGQYVNDKGRVEEWEAHYDEYGRQVERTDRNAGNRAQGIPDTHHHTQDFDSKSYHHGPTRVDHVPGPGPRSR